jgi:hypothetical protein
MATHADRRICHAEVVGIMRHLGIFLARDAEEEAYDQKGKQYEDYRIFHSFILP